MCSGPIDGKHGRFEEFFVGVFLADILLLEIFFRQLFDEKFKSREEVLFSEARMEDESLVLKSDSVDGSYVTARRMDGTHPISPKHFS
jgi:hypothetical protein